MMSASNFRSVSNSIHGSWIGDCKSNASIFRTRIGGLAHATSIEHGEGAQTNVKKPWQRKRQYRRPIWSNFHHIYATIKPEKACKWPWRNSSASKMPNWNSDAKSSLVNRCTHCNKWRQKGLEFPCKPPTPHMSKVGGTQPGEIGNVFDTTGHHLHLQPWAFSAKAILGWEQQQSWLSAPRTEQTLCYHGYWWLTSNCPWTSLLWPETGCQSQPWVSQTHWKLLPYWNQSPASDNQVLSRVGSHCHEVQRAPSDWIC